MRAFSNFLKTERQPMAWDMMAVSMLPAVMIALSFGVDVEHVTLTSWGIYSALLVGGAVLFWRSLNRVFAALRSAQAPHA